MAFAMAVKSELPPTGPIAYQHHQTAADATATTTVTTGAFGDLVTPGRWWIQAKILIKALSGTCSLTLETADNTSFSTNRQQIAPFAATTASILGSTILSGWTDIATNQYYRILMAFGTSGTVDIVVDANPVL